MILKRRKNNFLVFDDVSSFKSFFGFTKKEKLVEKDLKKIDFPEDINNRKELDAIILSLVAANVKSGKMLDIGTFFGRSATRMALNSPKSTIFTVNIDPNELKLGGKLTTGSPPKNKIGSFFKEKKLKNVKQIFANTKTWKIPNEINNLSLVYIDGCHDKEFVFNDTKKIIDKIIKGGFILWHDCSPIYRGNFHWIDESMSGIEKLIEKKIIKGYVFNVKNSWIGIWQKN